MNKYQHVIQQYHKDIAGNYVKLTHNEFNLLDRILLCSVLAIPIIICHQPFKNWKISNGIWLLDHELDSFRNQFSSIVITTPESIHYLYKRLTNLQNSLIKESEDITILDIKNYLSRYFEFQSLMWATIITVESVIVAYGELIEIFIGDKLEFHEQAEIFLCTLIPTKNTFFSDLWNLNESKNKLEFSTKKFEYLENLGAVSNIHNGWDKKRWNLQKHHSSEKHENALIKLKEYLPKKQFQKLLKVISAIQVMQFISDQKNYYFFNLKGILQLSISQAKHKNFTKDVLQHFESLSVSELYAALEHEFRILT